MTAETVSDEDDSAHPGRNHVENCVIGTRRINTHNGVGNFLQLRVAAEVVAIQTPRIQIGGSGGTDIDAFGRQTRRQLHPATSSRRKNGSNATRRLTPDSRFDLHEHSPHFRSSRRALLHRLERSRATSVVLHRHNRASPNGEQLPQPLGIITIASWVDPMQLDQHAIVGRSDHRRADTAHVAFLEAASLTLEHRPCFLWAVSRGVVVA
jgi:hypothetical protein